MLVLWVKLILNSNELGGGSWADKKQFAIIFKIRSNTSNKIRFLGFILCQYFRKEYGETVIFQF